MASAVTSLAAYPRGAALGHVTRRPPSQSYIAANGALDQLKPVDGMELNGNCTAATSGSVEDLSEYTDADESMSAPTEILAEFLSALMLKDYETALKYCKIILQYEPNHATAKEFYPLILEKIIQASAEAESSNGNGNGDTSSDTSDDESSSSTSTSSSSSSSSSRSSGSCESVSEGKESSDSDATTASYSSLEDEEADNATTSTIPKDDNAFLHPQNGNKEIHSDSESPTEPVSQQLVSRLRSKVLPIKL